RGAKKKESTGLRLNRLCPPYVTPSSISSFGRRPSSAHIAESKSLKNSGENTFCQSSASKWWSVGGEAPQLLINGEYAMTSAFDGRVTAAIRKGAPIKFVWEGAWLSYSYAAILKGGPNTGNAQKLFAFLNRAQIAAGFTQGTG
ncbi:spermidine/putrescine-binding protein, partial [Bradyrhizobium sp. GM2.2]